MTLENYTTTIIVADNGMTITNSDNSVLTKKVYLSKNDSASNYTEITYSEAEQILLTRTT